MPTYQWTPDFFFKGTRNSPWTKHSLFNRQYLSSWAPAHTKFQKDQYLSDCRKLSSKWVKDLYVDIDTLNPIERKGRNSHEFAGILKDFLSIIPLVQNLKSTINQLNLMKLRILHYTCQKTPSLGQRDRLKNRKIILSLYIW